MKFYKCILYYIILSFSVKGQTNLVPNYSFEQYVSCPNSTISPIYNATSWLEANSSGTSDYYNSCVINTPYYFGIPTNFVGYQFPRTGNGYAGIRVYAGPTYSGQLEYTQSKLIDTLKSNYLYCVQYFVSRADNYGNYGISNFSALFTNTLVNSSDPYNIQIIPQVKNPVGNIIMDKLGWSAINGTYTAVGNEQYITIGNFDPINTIDTLYDSQTNSCDINCLVYYYIDDVTVEEVANAKAGRDSIINCGDSLEIGADSVIGAYYKWTPSIGLSNDSIAFPIANPTITTTYVLKKTQCHIITYDTVKITVNGICPVIGINELNNTYHFKLYPNPSNEAITIEMDIGRQQTANIIIYNIIGEVVKSEKINSGKTSINMDNLKSGTYLYKIIIDNNIVKTDKLIIIK